MFGKSSDFLLFINYVEKVEGDWDVEKRGLGGGSFFWVVVGLVFFKIEKFVFFLDLFSGFLGII